MNIESQIGNDTTQDKELPSFILNKCSCNSVKPKTVWVVIKAGSVRGGSGKARSVIAGNVHAGNVQAGNV